LALAGNELENSVVESFDQKGLGLLDILRRMVFICEGNEIIYANPSAVAGLNAKNAEAMVGHPFSQFVNPDFADVISLGLDAFADEEDGVPLKLRGVTGVEMDVTLTVAELSDDVSGRALFLVECRDITKFIRASEEARQREERINNILESVAEAILTADENGVVLSVNPAAVGLFGYEPREIVGQYTKVLMGEGQHETFERHVSEYSANWNPAKKGQNREFLARHKNGHQFYIDLTLSKFIENSGGQVFTAIIRDITERKRREEELRHLAHHDTLTGLPNRALFDDRLEQTVIQSRRNQSLSAVMFIDLDKFKPINDELGHEAGDIVLKTVSRRLGECIRASDTVARVGGDEFVIILNKLDKAESAAQVADKIISSLTQPIDVGATDCTVGASIGISLFPADADSPEGLVKCGDEAMYRVKETGRNNYQFFNSEHNE
jgi:diguanylate cyclase (GGDEF)-like protein/PAS domain S-box-containing protein